jgi:hypothetical protein
MRIVNYLGKDNRLRIEIVYPDKRKTVMSYPKYLMEKHLDRYLEKNETVDHIDGNPLNNDISNLQVLDRKQHCYADAIRNKDITAVCVFCGKEFTIKGSTIRNRCRNRQDRPNSGPFCSRQCSGRYGAEIQNGRMVPIENEEKLKVERYKVKSAQEETTGVEAG